MAGSRDIEIQSGLNVPAGLHAPLHLALSPFPRLSLSPGSNPRTPLIRSCLCACRSSLHLWLAARLLLDCCSIAARLLLVCCRSTRRSKCSPGRIRCGKCSHTQLRRGPLFLATHSGGLCLSWCNATSPVSLLSFGETRASARGGKSIYIHRFDVASGADRWRCSCSTAIPSGDESVRPRRPTHSHVPTQPHNKARQSAACQRNVAHPLTNRPRGTLRARRLRDSPWVHARSG